MTENQPGTVFVGLLGPAVVHVDGNEVEIRGDRQQRLLAALAVRPGSVASVDRLTGIIWPQGDEPPDPQSTLHTYVYRLRRTLGSNDLVQAVDGGYRLDPDGVEIDWDRFEDAVESCAGLDRPDTEILDTLDAALSLWRGAPVERFADEEWIQPRVVRLEEQTAASDRGPVHGVVAVGPSG